MKKIMFMLPVMLCGGVEKSLLSLLNELPIDKYDIYIYLLKCEGDFLPLIPANVKVAELELEESVSKNMTIGGTKYAIKDSLRNKKYINVVKILSRHISKKYEFSELSVNFEKIEKNPIIFDVAICYHVHSPFILRYVAEKIEADIKLAWIHNDFETTHYNISKLKEYTDVYDQFYAVSEKLQNEFLNIFPTYREKVSIMHNLISVQTIQSMAKQEKAVEFERIDDTYIKLLTVGRLEYQKGIDLAIEVAMNLKNKGYKFLWIVLGEGNERGKLEKTIKKYNLDNYFLLVGNRINPYPYFLNCDIYVQPSRHEGFVTTITEAKLFCKPIVFTNVAGANEQIVNEVTGLITAVDSHEIFLATKNLMDNKELRNLFSENLSLVRENKNEIIQLSDLLEILD